MSADKKIRQKKYAEKQDLKARHIVIGVFVALFVLSLCYVIYSATTF